MVDQCPVMVLLDTVEVELKQLGLWSASEPEAEALASRLPFCVDTLPFPQWLQFVFIPKMRTLHEQNLAYPVGSGVASMAEEVFRDNTRAGALIKLLQQIDRELSQPS